MSQCVTSRHDNHPHVFGIRTPVSAILAATIGNVCIYVCAAFTGYAIADVLND